MLNPNPADYCRVGLAEMPRLVVVVDTEEEFDWSAPFSRENKSVQAGRGVDRMQRIFDEYHIMPTYVMDYPIVSQPEGYRPLQGIHASGRCQIGAHLHPWVNPPFEEVVNQRNSFPGNLPLSLEAAKLKILSECIAEKFGVRPAVYKAGRYGVGPHTAEILEQEGYEVDMSVCPHMDYSYEGGPDFTMSSALPYWFGRRRLLELPLTVGFAGILKDWGPALHRAATRPAMTALHAPGILARLGLVNKVWLSPEGYRSKELIALVRALLRDGLRTFSFAFHSPSLECGHTPYVRSELEREKFLSRCRKFFDFFMGDVGGICTTPLELKARWVQSTSIHTVVASNG
jgi:hypothetical protein